MAFGLTVLYFLLMLPNLNNSDPYRGDESFYTVSAVHMMETGEYLIPSYFGDERFNKPILNYWIVVAAYKLLGISMWSGRVPALVLACLTILITYRFGLLVLGDARKAVLAAAILTASPVFFTYSRVAMTDMPLVFLSSLAAMQYYQTLNDPLRSGRHALLGAIFSALAFMVKGPVGLIPLGATVLYVLPAGGNRWRLCRTIFRPACVLVFAVITVPWFVYALTLHRAAFAGDMHTELGTLWKTFSLTYRR